MDSEALAAVGPGPYNPGGESSRDHTMRSLADSRPQSRAVMVQQFWGVRWAGAVAMCTCVCMRVCGRVCACTARRGFVVCVCTRACVCVCARMFVLCGCATRTCTLDMDEGVMFMLLHHRRAWGRGGGVGKVIGRHGLVC